MKSEINCSVSRNSEENRMNIEQLKKNLQQILKCKVELAYKEK